MNHAVNWEAISAIGQIVGALSVVISLIYVAREIRCGTRRVLVAAILAGLSMQNALVAAQEPDQVSHEEKHKAVAMRVFEEIFNQKKLQVASEIYSPEFVNHGLRRDFSLQEDQAAARSEIKAFPDLHMTVALAV